MLTDSARNHYSANRMRCVPYRPIVGLEEIIKYMQINRSLKSYLEIREILVGPTLWPTAKGEPSSKPPNTMDHTPTLPPTLQNVLDQDTLKWIFCGMLCLMYHLPVLSAYVSYRWKGWRWSVLIFRGSAESFLRSSLNTCCLAYR
jgi:hypothetical protein